MDDYIKGIVTGGALVICAVLLIGFKNAPDSENGRYQIAITYQPPGKNITEAVIDTRTGEVSRRVFDVVLYPEGLDDRKNRY